MYVMSTDDEYHKKMIKESPAEEENSFYNLNGKFQKVFSAEELDEMYSQFKLVESRRIEKYTEFFGKSYYCKHHWRIYQK